MDARKLVDKVKKLGGTEVHLKIGAQPLYRKSRFLRKMESPAIEEDDMKGLIEQLLSETERKKFKKGIPFEANFFGKPPCNFRLSLFYSQEKPVAVIKIIDNRIMSFEEIGFIPQIDSMLQARKGLFILSGPARSGISTSLASLIERINQNQPKHVLVIEDPIEFLFEEKKSRISQRQFKKDIFSIEQGINFAKRMDVDVLVIGDLKRTIPFRNVLEYVSGGHFVILSMQTWGIANTLDKIIYSFPDEDREIICQNLAENLVGVCSQALINDMTKRTIKPIHEILVMNSTIQNIIQKGKVSQIEPNITGAGEGSQVFAQHLQKLYMKNMLDRTAGENFLELYRGIKG